MPPTPDRTAAIQMIRRGPVHAWNHLNGPTEFRNFVTEVGKPVFDDSLLKYVAQLLLTNPNNRLNDNTARKHPYFGVL